MNQKEFESGIEKLRDAYGANKYPSVRVQVMAKRLIGLPRDAFYDQIDKFIAEGDKAPFLTAFTEAFSGQIGDLRNAEIERLLRNEPSCSTCNGTGCAIYYQKETAYGYAFQCSCKRGKLLQSSYPVQYAGMGEVYIDHRSWVSGKYQKPRFNFKTKKMEGFKTLGEEIQGVTRNLSNRSGESHD